MTHFDHRQCGDCLWSSFVKPPMIGNTMTGKQYVKPGDVVTKELPFSEVCMYMRLAGKTRDVRVTEGRSGMFAEIRNDDGVSWGSPVTMGEAGFYRDQAGEYFTG